MLRRILRRAVRYGTEKLGFKPGDFAKLVDTVIELLVSVFKMTKLISNMYFFTMFCICVYVYNIFLSMYWVNFVYTYLGTD